MALIDDLKEMRESAKKRELERRAEAFEMQTWADVDAKYVRELDTAIAALTPAPAPVEIEIPETWETMERAEQGEVKIVLLSNEQDDASEFAEPAPDAEFVALDEQTCKPLDADLAQILHDNMDELLITDEAPALNADMHDEREQPVTDVAALIASGEHSYDEVAAIAYPEPQWNEPQTTEGYAPVTNPAADEAAKAYDWYDPKAVADRQKFNPFSLFRAKEDA